MSKFELPSVKEELWRQKSIHGVSKRPKDERVGEDLKQRAAISLRSAREESFEEGYKKGIQKVMRVFDQIDVQLTWDPHVLELVEKLDEYRREFGAREN